MSETNYQRFFGTPEKAAETLDLITKCCNECADFGCHKCPIGPECELGDIFEWLESEAE